MELRLHTKILQESRLISYQNFSILRANFGGFMVHACNNAVWSALEHCLVPPSASTTWYYATLLKKSFGAVCLLPLGVITGGFVGVQKVCSFAASLLTSPAVVDPKRNFQAVVDDSRLWSRIGTDAEIEQELIENPSGLPEPEIEGVG